MQVKVSRRHQRGAVLLKCHVLHFHDDVRRQIFITMLESCLLKAIEFAVEGQQRFRLTFDGVHLRGVRRSKD